MRARLVGFWLGVAVGAGVLGVGCNQVNHAGPPSDDGSPTDGAVADTAPADAASDSHDAASDGHSATVDTVLRSGNAAVSKDASGHWVLWDLAGRRAIASGDLPACDDGKQACPVFELGLVGDTLAVLGASEIELRTASTGALRATVPAASHAGLAHDGSYVWTATASRLEAHDLSGALLVDVAGDYHQAQVSADPDLLRVANGPAGTSALEVIALPDSHAITVPFAGAFAAWFDDGRHFLTRTGNTVSVYTSAGTPQAFGSLPTLAHLTGQGDFVWTYADASPRFPLQIYAAADLSAPVRTFTLPAGTSVIASGPMIRLIDPDSEVELIQLGVAITQPHFPALGLSAFGADSAAHWIVGGRDGLVFDGDAILAAAPGAPPLPLGAP
jgi:hypothetical protein